MVVNVLRDLKIHFSTNGREREREKGRGDSFGENDVERGSSFSFRELFEDVTDETSI